METSAKREEEREKKGKGEGEGRACKLILLPKGP